MNVLSKDPYLLLSVINTKLRDEYSSLADLCDDLNESINEINKVLNNINFYYDIKENQFKSK